MRTEFLRRLRARDRRLVGTGAAVVVLAAILVAGAVFAGGAGGGADPASARSKPSVVPTPTGPVTPDPPQIAAMKRSIEAEERRAREKGERDLNAAEDPLTQLDEVDGPARRACAGVYRAGAAWDRSDPATRVSLLTPVAADAVKSRHDPVAHSGRMLRVTLRSFGSDPALVADGMLSMAHGCGRAGLTPDGFRGDLGGQWACRELRKAVPRDAEAARRLWALAQHSVVEGLASNALALRDGLEAQARGEEPLVPLGEARDGLAAACRQVG